MPGGTTLDVSLSFSLQAMCVPQSCNQAQLGQLGKHATEWHQYMIQSKSGKKCNLKRRKEGRKEGQLVDFRLTALSAQTGYIMLQAFEIHIAYG